MAYSGNDLSPYAEKSNFCHAGSFHEQCATNSSLLDTAANPCDSWNHSEDKLSVRVTPTEVYSDL